MYGMLICRPAGLDNIVPQLNCGND